MYLPFSKHLFCLPPFIFTYMLMQYLYTSTHFLYLCSSFFFSPNTNTILPIDDFIQLQKKSKVHYSLISAFVPPEKWLISFVFVQSHKFKIEVRPLIRNISSCIFIM